MSALPERSEHLHKMHLSPVNVVNSRLVFGSVMSSQSPASAQALPAKNPPSHASNATSTKPPSEVSSKGPQITSQQELSNTAPSPQTAASSATAKLNGTSPPGFSLVAQSPGATYGASDFVWKLIVLVAQDVSRFKRNNRISHAIVARAQAIYDTINVLITKVDSDDVNDWTNYDTYNAAIDTLEDLLFKVANVTDLEAEQFLPGADLITDCVISTNGWKQHRQELRKYLGKFDSEPVLNALHSGPTPNGNAIGRYDDSALLSVICDKIRSFSDASGRGWIVMVKNEAPKLPGMIVDATTDDSMLHAIRSTMLFYGAMEIIASPSATSVLKKQLQSGNVGTKAESLLLALSSHLRKGRSSAAEDKALADKADAFERALMELPGVASLSPDWIELRKLAKDIRRPYHAQALVLVTQILTLVRHFNMDGNSSSENLKPLTVAIDTALKALRIAAAQNPSVERVDVDTIQNSPTNVAFAKAELGAQTCFTKYGLNSEWDRQKKIAEAVENDKERFVQMTSRLGKPSRGTPASNTILVTIHQGKATISYAVDGSTSLSAILLKEASRDPTLLQGWHFEQVDKRRRGFHEDVKAVESSDKTKRTLYLVAD